VRLDSRYVQLYRQKYIKLDPTTLGYFIADIEQPVSAAEVMPYDEFLASRFYKEWAKPQGVVDSVHAMLDKTVTTAAALVVFRHRRDGLVDDEARQRMRLIVPHFRRAVLIGRVIDLKKAEAASLADTLDGISAGIFLVDETGRIVHGNVAGHGMLNAADVLHAKGGLLAANDQEANRVLADAFATAGNGDAAVGIKGVAVPLVAGDGERYVAHLLAIDVGGQATGRRKLRRSSGAVRVQSGARYGIPSGDYCQGLQAHANGTAGIAGRRPGRRRSRSRRGSWHCRDDSQNPSRGRLQKDRSLAPG